MSRLLLLDLLQPSMMQHYGMNRDVLQLRYKIEILVCFFTSVIERATHQIGYRHQTHSRKWLFLVYVNRNLIYRYKIKTAKTCGAVICRAVLSDVFQFGAHRALTSKRQNFWQLLWILKFKSSLEGYWQKLFKDYLKNLIGWHHLAIKCS